MNGTDMTTAGGAVPGRCAVSGVRRLFYGLAIAAAVLVAYGNSFDKAFLFDDAYVVTGLERTRSLSGFEVSRRCVTDLTFVFNHALDGYNVAGYHAVNLLIHVLATLFLFGILCRTLAREPFRSRLGTWRDPLAAFTAALWGVHPLQTQAVTYVCQRYESMMGLCFLAFLYCAIRAMAPGAGRGWWPAALACFGLGMGTKEVMAVAPLVLLAYDFVWVAPSWRELWKTRGRWYGFLFLAVGVYSAILAREILRQARGAPDAVLFQVTPFEYLITQSEVIVHYLRLAFWPYPLCLDYWWAPASSIREVAGPLVGLGALVVLGGYALIRRRSVGFLVAWFFLILAPTSSVIPVVDIAVEHRMYLPLAAVMAGVTVGVSWSLCGRLRTAPAAATRRVASIGVGLLAALILLGVAATRARNEAYTSVETMWRDVVRHRPDNYRQQVSLVHALLSGGRYDEAETRARELIARITAALADPAVRTSQKQWALKYAVSARNALGCILHARGRYDEAIELFRQAIQDNGRSVYAANLVLSLMAAGRLDEARAECRAAIEADPTYGKSHALMGYLSLAAGDERGAVLYYRRALDLAPDSVPVMLDMARLLAGAVDPAVRDGQQAVRLAQAVLDTTGGRSFRAHEVMAIARAGLGDLPGALAAMEQALKRLDESGLPDEVRRDIRSRFEVLAAGYREGEPTSPGGSAGPDRSPSALEPTAAP